MKKIYAFLMMAATMVACMQMEQPMPVEEQETPKEQEQTVQTYTMTVEATKSGDKDTKALSLTGKTLNATWAEGEIVEVYQSGSKIGELSAAASDNASTTLSGSFEEAPSTSASLTFHFHTAADPSYSGQDGTLETIASTYDFCAPATVTVGNFTVNETTKTISVPGGISFGENLQAIVKFTLFDKADGETRLNPTNFSFSYGSGVVSLTNIPDATYLANGNGVLYMAIPGFSASAINLSATVGGTAYSYSKSGISFADGQYYEINVKMMENEMLATPLTFEAVTSGTSITFINRASGPVTYTVNGESTQTIAADATTNISVNAGDKVCFYGDNATYSQVTKYSWGGPDEPEEIYVSSSTISCSADCYVYGNIMSLVNSIGFATATELTADYTFYELFCNYYNYDYQYSGSFIKSHATKPLVLPATTLTEHCYESLFERCKSLTTSPVLPATTLTEGCYTKMFLFCDNLTTAPVLPSTSLAKSCYEEMFYQCKNLATAPDLPATTLEESCYRMMFDGCTNLTTAPVLRAQTLVSECYFQMFNNCSKLNSVTCLATDISASRCTRYWLNDVATTGTFTQASGVSWSSGADGIPSGWTVNYYSN